MSLGSRVATGVLCTLSAGFVAYYVAIALGATHTRCTGNATSGFCDTTPDVWAFLAAIVFAIIGAFIAFVILPRDMVKNAE
jgi:hypothetical protein